jgi:hypothetical protein
MSDEGDRSNVYDIVGKRARRGLGETPSKASPLEDATDPPDPPIMDETIRRLEIAVARLEGAFEGLRHSQNLTIGALGLVGTVISAIVISFGIYTLQRIDALPADFERLNATLSSAITAAKQQPPQVILVPAPQQSPAPAAPAKP